MIKALVTLLKLLIVAAIGYFGFTWWTEDEKVVTRKTEELITYFVKGLGDKDYLEGSRTKNFTDLLADDVIFKYDRETIPQAEFINSLGAEHGKDQLEKAHARLSSTRTILVITDEKIEIGKLEVAEKDSFLDDIEGLKGRANVEVNCNLNCKYDGDREFNLIVKCFLRFKKIKGEWKISHIILQQENTSSSKKKSKDQSGFGDKMKSKDMSGSNDRMKSDKKGGFTDKRPAMKSGFGDK